MTSHKLKKCVAAVVKNMNGQPKHQNADDEFIVPTRYGDLSIHVIEWKNPWMALRFVTYSTGKVYDSLHGYDFNGYSGKWNINLGSQGLDRNEKGRRIIRDRLLESFIHRMELVKK